METIDRHAPLKKRRLGKAKTPWINKNLLAGKWQKNIRKRKACKTNTPNYWKSYKVVKNQHSRLIKNTIKSYYTEEIRNNKGNLKYTWKTITLKMIRTRRFWVRTYQMLLTNISLRSANGCAGKFPKPVNNLSVISKPVVLNFNFFK